VTAQHVTGTQSGITVNPGATHLLVLSRFPVQDHAGVAQSFRVTAQGHVRQIHARLRRHVPTNPHRLMISSTDPQFLPIKLHLRRADLGFTIHEL